MKKVLVHHFWPIGLARNLIEIFTFTPQATPCSIRLLAIHIQNYTFLCSSDDQNDINLYSLDNAFDISAAAAVTVLSPIAVVKNGLILATIWRRNFVRTSLHIFLNRLAMTDLLGDLIGGPLHALRIFISRTFYSFSMTICPQIVKLCLFRHRYCCYHGFDVI